MLVERLMVCERFDGGAKSARAGRAMGLDAGRRRTPPIEVSIPDASRLYS